MDHTGGLAQIKNDSGGQLISGEKDKPLLEGGYYPGQNDEFLLFPPVKVDRVVHEGDTVTLGNVTLTAHETPGHTPGCTSWTTTARDGDATRSVIFFCSATVALNKLVTNPTYPGIIDDYKKTFAWSKTVHPDVLLAPHPEMYDMPGKRAKIADGSPNPFVKPGEFNAFCDDLDKQFVASLEKETAAAQAKK
jgi:metallo-beta-lactamase class B